MTIKHRKAIVAWRLTFEYYAAIAVQTSRRRDLRTERIRLVQTCYGR